MSLYTIYNFTRAKVNTSLYPVEGKLWQKKQPPVLQHAYFVYWGIFHKRKGKKKSSTGTNLLKTLVVSSGDNAARCDLLWWKILHLTGLKKLYWNVSWTRSHIQEVSWGITYPIMNKCYFNIPYPIFNHLNPAGLDKQDRPKKEQRSWFFLLSQVTYMKSKPSFHIAEPFPQHQSLTRALYEFSRHLKACSSENFVTF